MVILSIGDFRFFPSYILAKNTTPIPSFNCDNHVKLTNGVIRMKNIRKTTMKYQRQVDIAKSVGDVRFRAIRHQEARQFSVQILQPGENENPQRDFSGKTTRTLIARLVASDRL